MTAKRERDDAWPVLSSYEGTGVFEATSQLSGDRLFAFALGERHWTGAEGQEFIEMLLSEPIE